MTLSEGTHSTLNRFFFSLRRRLRWSRAGYVEHPVTRLTGLTSDQETLIKSLSRRYGISFEMRFNRENTLENYHILDLLHQSQMRFQWKMVQSPTLIDVGSKNFYYAPVLQTFFKPRSLIGVEIDGYKVYRDLHSRFDYAQTYIKNLPNAEYQVLDFCDFSGSADFITGFYPFVFIEPLLAWNLPKQSFKPDKIFTKVYETLNDAGYFLMVNHGRAEYEAARELVLLTGLSERGYFSLDDGVFQRDVVPQVSLWQKEKNDK